MKKQTILTLIVILSCCIVQAQITTTVPQRVVKPINSKVANTMIEPPTKINLENITEWLCPQTLKRGDREFDGHGPKIKCNVKIRIAPNKKEIWADIYLWAQETVSDFSTTEATWSKKVYDAPIDKLIDQITSDKESRTEFVSPPAGMQILIPGADFRDGMKRFFDGKRINDDVLKAHNLPVTFTEDQIMSLITRNVNDNSIITVPALQGTLVDSFEIVGDTGGDDISNDDNCKDDTRINKITFFPVFVKFKK